MAPPLESPFARARAGTECVGGAIRSSAAVLAAARAAAHAVAAECAAVAACGGGGGGAAGIGVEQRVELCVRSSAQTGRRVGGRHTWHGAGVKPSASTSV